MRYFLYKITNTINGKIYIGKTNNIAHRWRAHKSAAVRKDPNDFSIFHRAIAKHGASNFIVEKLEEYESEEKCLEAEINSIRSFNSINRDIGYNMTEGGDGISGFNHSEETRKKISEYVKSHPPSGQFKIGNQQSFDSKLKVINKIRKLNDEQLSLIREEINKGELTQKEIGNKFKVNQSVISRIKTKKSHNY